MTLPWIATNEEQQPRVEMYWAALRGAGHAIERREVFTMYPVYVGETDEQARREVIEHWHRWRAFAMEAQNLTPENPTYQRVFGHLDYDAMVRDSRGVFGGPETCVRILKRIIEIVGATHVGLTFHFGGLPQNRVLQSMERCARVVLPAFR